MKEYAFLHSSLLSIKTLFFLSRFSWIVKRNAIKKAKMKSSSLDKQEKKKKLKTTMFIIQPWQLKGFHVGRTNQPPTLLEVFAHRRHATPIPSNGITNKSELDT
jgi:hypothetical protein